jgi:glutathione peroxidase
MESIKDKTTVYDFSALTITGENKSLSDYRGKVLVIVNTASQCAFTPQYGALQELYKKYRGDGLEILGFPCNQFANQEPGINEEILKFARETYGVEFQMFSKIDVNGDNAHPLYKWLTTSARGFLGTKSIKWNFTKFLIDREGKLYKRFSSKSDPYSMEKDIRELLGLE